MTVVGRNVHPWRPMVAALLMAGGVLGPCGARAAVDADPSTQPEAAAARGRALVAQRTVSLCLLCHHAPIEEERFQGDLGPDLAGVGARLSVAQLRQRLVDPTVFNPATIMPSYARTEGLERVGRAWLGRPLLDAQQIDDIAAWLSTLRN